MYKFFKEKIEKPADELVKLAEINKELSRIDWENKHGEMEENDIRERPEIFKN